MVSALAYAAEKGLVHRDINPSNVIVLPNDRIKLIDFGLAGPIGTDDFQPDGNFHYQAPELFDGEPADFRSDIFSLGLTAFHMVSGRLPFLSENPAEVMKMMRTRTIPDPGKQVEDLPEILRQFILTACSRDPDQRFQTPKQAQAFLSNETPVKKIHPALPGKALTRTLTFEIGPGREEEFSRLIHELDQKLVKINSRIRKSKKG
jgi:serine/threonine protein kinase